MTEMKKITPELAAEILAITDHNNRKISERRAFLFTKKIVDGKFYLSTDIGK